MIPVVNMIFLNKQRSKKLLLLPYINRKLFRIILDDIVNRFPKSSPEDQFGAAMDVLCTRLNIGFMDHTEALKWFINTLQWEKQNGNVPLLT